MRLVVPNNWGFIVTDTSKSVEYTEASIALCRTRSLLASLNFKAAERHLKCVKASAYTQNSRFFERSPPWPHSVTRVKEKFTKTCITLKARPPDT